MCQFDKKIPILLVCVILLGAFLRLYGLKSQGFFMYDGAGQIYRANYILAQMSLPFEDQNIGEVSYDLKPLWLFLGLIAKFLAGGHIYGVLVLSAVSGILSLILCYFFAEKINCSKTHALLSTLFLAVFSYHVFYSRLAMPEAAAGLGFLLCTLLYLKSVHGSNRFAALAGFTAGLFFLMNYRLVFAPIYILLLQGMLWFKDRSQNLKPVIVRSSYLILAFIIIFPAYELILYCLRMFQIVDLKSYFLTFPSTTMSEKFFHVPSIVTVFYILSQTEGFLFTALLLVAMILTRKNIYLFWMTVIILFQMILSTIPAEKPFRVMAPLLPFMAILAAGGLKELWTGLGQHKLFRLIPVIFLLVISFQGTRHSLEVTAFKSAMPNAVAFIKHKFQAAPILTSNRPVTRLSAYPIELDSLYMRSIKDMDRYINQGYRALILDPQKYISATFSGPWSDLRLSTIITSFEDHCTPMIRFKHLSPRMLQYFFFEHVGPTLEHTLQKMKMLNQHSGDLTVYDIHYCVEVLKQKKVYPEN